MRCALAIAVMAAAGVARADAPITDRSYAIDFYDGVALGNTALVGMGGAGAAFQLGTAGVLINASAPAVRPTTDNDMWSWDYHLDYLSSKYSTDYDNNGRVADDAGAQLLTLGLGVRRNDWAVAVTATAQSTEVDGGNVELQAQALRVRYVLAKWFPRWDLAIGAGVQSVNFGVDPDEGEDLFSINGLGFIAGVTYAPHGKSYRLAAGLETQILGTTVDTDCDPTNCEGYILPEKVTSPARLVLGFAHRLARSDWNQQVTSKFRDELAITVTTDLVITGSSPDAYGIEAFGQKMLQRSGEDSAISLRAGTETELVPGRLRIRLGSYWEPQRFEDVGGRLHGTFGIELRVLEEHVWGLRRGRLSFTGDVAERYRNVAVSIGFWH